MRENGVVCAINVHQFDQQVVDVAATFAKHFKCELELIYVSPTSYPSEAAWPAFFGPPSQLMKDHQQLLQVNTEVADVPVHRHHLSGFPVKQILGFVERCKPRLLVIGTRSKTKFQQIFGSIGIKIFRQAPCPVTVLQHQSTLDLSSE